MLDRLNLDQVHGLHKTRSGREIGCVHNTFNSLDDLPLELVSDDAVPGRQSRLKANAPHLHSDEHARLRGSLKTGHDKFPNYVKILDGSSLALVDQNVWASVVGPEGPNLGELLVPAELLLVQDFRVGLGLTHPSSMASTRRLHVSRDLLTTVCSKHSKPTRRRSRWVRLF
ncbi:porphobilinogen deaminase [Striga asiatica]|uniref:Porphobilinogen deaminase n=1 Tax=Striga asiatica TaxID=4170 RepID=A0A5A7QBB1_STRAF|nr:porphobilinogen deaminase [Striga asiatica]